ncbi:MAG: hypothetical protein ABIK89_22310, partial [Planctomycetota bacterium]
EEQSAQQTPTPDDPGSSAPSASDGAPPFGREDIPDTKVTSAFRAFATADSGSSEVREESGELSETFESSVIKEPGQEKTGDHFTVVEEEELDRGEPEEPIPRALISPQTWVLAIGLIAVSLTAWYLLRPPSDDALYRRIMATTADRKIPSLLAAEDDIQEFLMRFSNDSRCQELRYFKGEIELYRLRRRLEESRRERGDREALLPIERAYQEAIDLGQQNPKEAIEQLQAIVDLYGDRADDSGPTGQYLQLIQRDLKRLRLKLDEWEAQDLGVLNARLDRADELARGDSAEQRQQAQEMRRAVIQLYADKPWAAEAVQRARDALAGEDESS